MFEIGSDNTLLYAFDPSILEENQSTSGLVITDKTSDYALDTDYFNNQNCLTSNDIFMTINEATYFH